jgi:hypothetical protein
MTTPKYRLEYKVGTVEFSSPCSDEIQVLKEITELESTKFQIIEYTGETVSKSGIRSLTSQKITKKQFMQRLNQVVFNKE